MEYKLGYKSEDYIRPYISVDIVLLRVHEEETTQKNRLPVSKLQVLMINRPFKTNEPFPGYISLPGGVAIEGKTLEETAEIKLKEKTGISNFEIWRQLPAFSDPKRDIRNHVISIPFISIVEKGGQSQNIQNCLWMDIESVFAAKNIAFDHKDIIKAAYEKIKRSLWKSDVALKFLNKRFILSEVFSVYQLFGDDTARVNFKRDFQKLGIAFNTKIKEESGRKSGAQGEYWEKK